MKNEKKQQLANEELQILKNWLEGLPSMLKENQNLLEDTNILDKLIVILFESILHARRHYQINPTKILNKLFDMYYLERFKNLITCINNNDSFYDLFDIPPISLQVAYKNSVKKYAKKNLFEVLLLVILNMPVYCKQGDNVSISKLEQYILKSKPIFDNDKVTSRNDAMQNYIDFLLLVQELL